MDITGVLKDNIKVFLPVLGLVIVLIAFFAIDLESTLFTDITPAISDKKSLVEDEGPPRMMLEKDLNYMARVKTSLGEFTIDLFQDFAPENVNNFVYLAEKGFYKNLTFHRVIENFIIQTGDPDGTGYGNAGYYIKDEISKSLKFDPYIVAMANEGKPNTNSSQFFVTLRDGDFSHLEGDYTIIGRVIEGSEVVEEIGTVRVDGEFAPRKDVILRDIDILKERK